MTVYDGAVMIVSGRWGGKMEAKECVEKMSRWPECSRGEVGRSEGGSGDRRMLQLGERGTRGP